MVPRLLSNGSEIIDGMLLNVVENSVDFIWTSLYFNLERNKYIEYLPSIFQGHPAIFIANQDFETIDWNLYLQPFSFQLWIMIIIVAFTFALVIYGIQWTHLLNKPVGGFPIEIETQISKSRFQIKYVRFDLKPFNFYRKITERANTIQDCLVDFRSILSEK